jgi:hypothetical protein
MFGLLDKFINDEDLFFLSAVLITLLVVDVFIDELQSNFIYNHSISLLYSYYLCFEMMVGKYLGYYVLEMFDII